MIFHHFRLIAEKRSLDKILPFGARHLKTELRGVDSFSVHNGMLFCHEALYHHAVGVHQLHCNSRKVVSRLRVYHSSF